MIHFLHIFYTKISYIQIKCNTKLPHQLFLIFPKLFTILSDLLHIVNLMYIFFQFNRTFFKSILTFNNSSCKKFSHVLILFMHILPLPFLRSHFLTLPFYAFSCAICVSNSSFLFFKSSTSMSPSGAVIVYLIIFYLNCFLTLS